MKFFIIVSLLITHATARKPNLILIYMDDMGYGDIGCFGSTKNRTPILDQMAREGRRFTDFYVTSGVCTPSRSSLLTGCYPRRLNMHIDQNNKWVLFPNARKGLNPEETTVAELLKKQGYATTCIGKWHLGDQPEFLPTNHGFDSYFGIPYSNDMGRKNIPLPLLRDDKVIEAPVAQSPVTRRYTDEAVKFIKANREKPFFLYLPHTSVHLPLFPGEDFKGKAANGKYGDWIEEVDACTGVILQTLRDEKLDQDTLVIFTSDNGGTHKDNLPLRGKKGMFTEGGIRVPLIVYWPGVIPANTVTDHMVHTVDYYPTYLQFAGDRWMPPEAEHPLDGESFVDVLLNPNTDRMRDPIFYLFPGYMDSRAQPTVAAIDEIEGQRYKLLYFYEADDWEFYNLSHDIGEKTNLIKTHTSIAASLSQKIHAWLSQKHSTWKPKYPLKKDDGKSVGPPPSF